MKPTDDTIALVAFLLTNPRRSDAWKFADELRRGMQRLGFEMPSGQWVSGRLAAMCRESAPRFERRRMHWTGGVYEYRVTSWGAQGLRNQWEGFAHHPSFAPPTPQPEHLRPEQEGV